MLRVREPTSPAQCRALDQQGRKRWRAGTTRRLRRRPSLLLPATADAAPPAARKGRGRRAGGAGRSSRPPPPPSAGAQGDPLQAMREVNLAQELRRKVCTLQSPPGPTRGALKNALAAGLAEVQRDPRFAEGWKLFLLAPRMLLFRGRGKTRVPRAQPDKRVVPRRPCGARRCARPAERAAALAHLSSRQPAPP